MTYIRTRLFVTIAVFQGLVALLAADWAAAQPQPIATFKLANAQVNEYLGLCTATDGQRVFPSDCRGWRYTG